ncbi:MAG TPA: sulfotransferase [Terriglobales bacterium]|nr:sulfotransferase [Terriglobales bacterium]
MRHHFIFVAGLHRSGTSLLHELLRAHPSVSGFRNTNVPEDEGQHLQTVFPAAKAFGGPGRFGFNRDSFMDENHPLATPGNAERLFSEWSRYWDLSKPFLVEKSPPNLVRTRFLQALFPDCSFLVILRHPIAVAYATQKWAETSIESLLDHTLLCYERFQADMRCLQRVQVVRYEDFVLTPLEHLTTMSHWLGVSPFQCGDEVRARINDRYFASWRRRRDLQSRRTRSQNSQLVKRFSSRTAAFGYRMDDPETLDPFPWAGTATERGVCEQETALGTF